MEKSEFNQLIEVISDFREMVAKKFEEQEARFDAHDARFDAHDARFDAHDAMFASQNEKITELSKSIGWVKDVLDDHTLMLRNLDDERLAGIHRTDRIEKDIVSMKKQLKLA